MPKRLKKKAVASYITEHGSPPCGECGEGIGADGTIILSRTGRPQWVRCRPCIKAWSARHPRAMERRYRR